MYRTNDDWFSVRTERSVQEIREGADLARATDTAGDAIRAAQHRRDMAAIGFVWVESEDCTGWIPGDGARSAGGWTMVGGAGGWTVYDDGYDADADLRETAARLRREFA